MCHFHGITEEYASILVEHESTRAVVLANEKGEFSYTYSAPMPQGTNISFTCKEYNSVVYCTKKIQVVYSGELMIESATNQFNFDVYPIRMSPILCPRQRLVKITVVDSRVLSSDWKLYATLTSKMQSESGEKLEGALVFVEGENIQELTDTPTLVYTGKNNEGSLSVTDIKWEKGEGILLKITEPLKNNVSYDAEITWTIEE